MLKFPLLFLNAITLHTAQLFEIYLGHNEIKIIQFIFYFLSFLSLIFKHM